MKAKNGAQKVSVARATESNAKGELVVTGFMVVENVKGTEKHLSRVYTAKSAADDLALARKYGHPDATIKSVYNLEHGAKKKHVGPTIE